jgi:hypothetical protein
MKILSPVLVLLGSFLFLQCSLNTSKSDAYSGEQMTREYASADYEESSQPEASTEPAVPLLEKGSKIIRSGSMELEVEQLGEAKTRIDTLVAQLGGYYQNENYYTYSGRGTYTLEIRVPGEQFDRLIRSLEQGSGKLRAKSIAARDVTEEYVDVSVRLENNEAYLRQYRELLKRASKISDILEVQEKIRVLEEEMDSRKGRLRYLDDQVAYSTLQLNLVGPGVEATSPGFLSRLGESLAQGATLFVDFLLALAYLWPFLLLLLLLLVFRKRIFGGWGKKEA